MNRSYQYLFLSLFLLFAFTSFYICFDIYVEGSEFDKKRILFLSQQLEHKKLEIQLVKLQQNEAPSRMIASVDPEAQKSLNKLKHKDADLSEFYFLRIDELKREKKYKQALALVEKIKKTTADEEQLARADYELIAIQCPTYKLNEVCIDALDKMVLQYPQSYWTGRGLVWLSKTYSGLNRKEESFRIEQIIKNDFSGLKVE